MGGMLPGFFGFLRSGEFTVTTYNSCPLRPSDIAVDSHTLPSIITVTLRVSKTDQFGEGTITIGKTDTALCPVAAILAYLARCATGSMGHIHSQWQKG